MALAERVHFTGEHVSGGEATVRAWLRLPEGGRSVVEYRLRRAGGRWVAHDVVMDGVGFVAAHGAHLRYLLESSSWDDLIWKLRFKEVEARQ
jgi:hypothetical protein